MRASNCKYETQNGRCGLKGSYAYRHKCFTVDLCKCHDPMTNADHIRAMTDEELAKWIFGFFWGRKSDVKLLDLAGWLKQPYGGADHE